MSRSFVVTGGGRGVGRAVVERLIHEGGSVVVIELDKTAVGWMRAHPSNDRNLWMALGQVT